MNIEVEYEGSRVVIDADRIPGKMRYRKTVTVPAVQLPLPFSVPTMEGTMKGKSGDYLLGPGEKGEYWPVDREVFERTYRLAEDEPKEAVHLGDVEQKVVQMLNALQDQVLEMVITLYRVKVFTADDVRRILRVSDDRFFEAIEAGNR